MSGARFRYELTFSTPELWNITELTMIIFNKNLVRKIWQMQFPYIIENVINTSRIDTPGNSPFVCPLLMSVVLPQILCVARRKDFHEKWFTQTHWKYFDCNRTLHHLYTTTRTLPWTFCYMSQKFYKHPIQLEGFGSVFSAKNYRPFPIYSSPSVSQQVLEQNIWVTGDKN